MVAIRPRPNCQESVDSSLGCLAVLAPFWPYSSYPPLPVHTAPYGVSSAMLLDTRIGSAGSQAMPSPRPSSSRGSKSPLLFSRLLCKPKAPYLSPQPAAQPSLMRCCSPSMAASATVVTMPVTTLDSVSSTASTSSSKIATHSMAPAAKPRPTGRKGMNCKGKQAGRQAGVWRQLRSRMEEAARLVRMQRGCVMAAGGCGTVGMVVVGSHLLDEEVGRHGHEGLRDAAGHNARQQST